MKTRIVNEFFVEKERTRMESVFSETLTDSFSLPHREENIQ